MQVGSNAFEESKAKIADVSDVDDVEEDKDQNIN